MKQHTPGGVYAAQTLPGTGGTMRIVRMDYGEYCRHFAAYARRPGTYDAQRYEVDVLLPPDLEYTPRRFVAVRLPV